MLLAWFCFNYLCGVYFTFRHCISIYIVLFDDLQLNKNGMQYFLQDVSF